MLRKILFIAALAAAFPVAAVPAPIPTYIKAAVADSARPAADVKRDAERKPAQMLLFAGVKPGMKVVDLLPGGGYFTRLFAKAVGPKGFVYAYFPAEMDAMVKKRGGDVNDLGKPFDAYGNVGAIHGTVEQFATPEPVDLVWTSQNYHDLHDSLYGPANMMTVNKAIYAALKPGGIYIVLDHAAAPGTGTRDTQTLHRIDEAAVKSEVEAAGFKLIGESNVLRNPKDDHTLKVFDPAIRGHTDQFILKFQKPRR
jgi:predicted methyltransferase